MSDTEREGQALTRPPKPVTVAVSHRDALRLLEHAKPKKAKPAQSTVANMRLLQLAFKVDGGTLVVHVYGDGAAKWELIVNG